MTATFIACVNKLAYNEPKKFIFTDHRGSPIGEINITVVDRDAGDSNKNQAPQDTPHEFQATEETEGGAVIIYPKIDLDINHKTPI